MASFTLYDTNLEWRNSSENTTESTENVCSSVRYCDQSIFLVSSYTSSAVVALKWRIGLSILMAVCSWKLARYMSSLLPLNDTIRLPICTSLAPSSVSSFAKTGSRPMNVLAINSNSCSICCLVWILPENQLPRFVLAEGKNLAVVLLSYTVGMVVLLCEVIPFYISWC